MPGVACSLGVFFAGEDSVSVGSFVGPEACVEVIGDVLCLDDGEIVGEDVVDDEGEFVGWDLARGVVVYDLSTGVGSAIGSTCADDLDIFIARDLANVFCQCAVDSSLSFLWGEPTKIVAVVGDGELDSTFSRQARGRQ